MKNISAAAMAVFVAGSLFVLVPSAGATVVEYSTTGIFSGSGTNKVNLITVNGNGFTDYVQYTGVNNVTTNVGNSPVKSSAGSFLAAVLHDSSGTASGDFTLTVNQTVPGVASGNFPAVFSGTLSRVGGGENVSGQLVLTFAAPSINIGGIQYSIDGLGQGGLAANQLGLGLYITDINVDIANSPVPEPAFAGLIAMGLAGFTLIAVRRRRLHS